MEKHTFLFEPGAWRVHGTYCAANDKPCTVTGEALIVHEQDLWVNDSVLRVQFDPPVEIRQRYAVRPLATADSTTTWVAESTDLGTLYGSLRVLPDRIVSVYVSGDGQYSGFEHLTLRTDGSYDANGALMRGQQQLASWSTTLTRRPQ